jgi:hypothetical protein
VSEPGAFERAVLRELDQIRKAFEDTVERLERQDESRDSEVSDLKLQVGLLRGECRRNIKRDAGLVIAPSTIVAVLQWVFMPGHAPPPPPRPAPAAIVAPAHTPAGG